MCLTRWRSSKCWPESWRAITPRSLFMDRLDLERLTQWKEILTKLINLTLADRMPKLLSYRRIINKQESLKDQSRRYGTKSSINVIMKESISQYRCRSCRSTMKKCLTCWICLRSLSKVQTVMGWGLDGTGRINLWLRIFLFTNASPKMKS
jgi:hypothetical protein